MKRIWSCNRVKKSAIEGIGRSRCIVVVVFILYQQCNDLNGEFWLKYAALLT